MSEYIEREAAIAMYEDDGIDMSALKVPVPVIVQNLKDVPAADVREVKRGKWTKHYVGQENVPWGSDCSVCGEWLVIDRRRVFASNQGRSDHHSHR